MLVVVASRHDQIAKALAAGWAEYGAVVLSPADLSTVGWRYYAGAPHASTAAIAGQIVAVQEITGVLTRLAYIPEQELGQIAAADRTYVAAEMTAFMLAWLSELACPVLNRPASGCLAGPNWRQEEWVCTAARLGIPAQPVRRRVALGAAVAPRASEGSVVTVTVVGDRCFGQVDDALMRASRRLADAADVELLAVYWSGAEAGARLVGANEWPEVSSPEIASAVLDYLTSGGIW